VVTLFLIVEGLLPGPLLTWAKNGLTDFIGSFQ
jgi:hypothetical protein